MCHNEYFIEKSRIRGGKQTSTPIYPEPIRLYQLMRRAYAALTTHDETEAQVMNLLKRFAEHESNPSIQQTTLNYAKDLMSNMMNVNRLVQDRSYHTPIQQILAYLHIFMRSHQVYCVE